MLKEVQSFTTHAERWADDDSIPWKRLILSTVLLVSVFENYVSWRQYRLYSRPAPPAALASYVDLETYRKASAYSRDKSQYSFVKDVIATGTTLALIQSNGFAWMWLWAGCVLHHIGLSPESEVGVFL